MRNTKKEQNKKEEKYYSDEQLYDYHFNFTKEMMKDLHDDGELIVKVEKDGQEMIVKFTYDVEAWT